MSGATRPSRVAVLVSTYNGAEFLPAQLQSLASQEGVSLEVFARDDGSTDDTIAILRDHADRWPALADVVPGVNLGPAASFLELLRTVPKDFDYYAFCDQDDVWMADKLLRATGMIAAAAPEKPTLYCSSSICVDRDLRPLGETLLRGTGRFEQIIFANITGGNTMVLNVAAAELINARAPGAAMIMHDWWCILVIAALGLVICDEQPTILYRQHQQNTVGSAPGRLSGLILQLKQFLRDPRGFYPIRAQAAELLRLYGGQLGTSDRRLAEALVASHRSLASRIHYAAFGKIVRFDALGALGTRVLIAAGLY